MHSKLLKLFCQKPVERGLFIEQAKAFLQLSIILRYRGEYDKVFEILSRVEKLAVRHEATLLRDTLALEQIYFAIDLGDPKYAKLFVDNLPYNDQGYF